MSTRRMFLKRAGATVAVVSCPAFYGACGGGGVVAAGNVADYAEGDLVAIVGEGIAIGMDADGLYAMTTFCSHSNCDIQDTGTIDAATGLECSCHGSTFDTNGGVTNGPATTDLEHYSIEIDEAGDLLVDTDSTVGAADRF